MKNQSRTIKTNPELYRVVMGSSGGHRKLPGGSDHFSLQTHKQTNISSKYIYHYNTHNHGHDHDRHQPAPQMLLQPK